MARNVHGDFIWYELIVGDPQAAADFYGKVVGWTVETGDNDYRHIKAGDEFVGGMFALTEDMASQGARPAWIGYVGVDDVDGAVASVEQGGGRVLAPAMTMEGVGRFALVADPQGAPFYVMRGEPDETSRAFAADRLGHCAWNELATSDPEAALRFYGAQFGWASAESMPMGAMGDYRFIAHDGRQIGAVMQAQGGMPAMWRFYFRVAVADEAARAAAAAGGELMFGPQQIPTGERIVIGADPQGAVFALVGK